VSAYHQYELRLNGTVVDRGPAFSYPGEGYYQATDITSQVKAGSPLAIGIIYHWYGAGKGRPAAVPGLLGRFVVQHADGTQDVILTDGNWHVRRASQWQTGAPTRSLLLDLSQEYVEQIDSTKRQPVGTSLATLTQHHPGLSPRWWACTPLACLPT